MDSSLLKHEQQKKNNKFTVSQKTEESAQLQDWEHQVFFDCCLELELLVLKSVVF